MRLLATAAALIGALAVLPGSATASSGRAFDFEVAPHGKVVETARPFNLVGMRWQAGARKPDISVQVRRPGRGWSRWAELHARGRASDPLWVGRATAVRYRLSRRVPGLRLHFVNVGRFPSARAHAAQTGEPTFVSRSEWGAGQCRPRTTPEYGSVKAVVVHHTVSLNDYSAAEAPAIVLAICRYHRNSNGWNDIGYNFLVDKYGQVFEGRAGGIDQAVVGAHAQGYNSVSTGIACLGDFTAIAQTPQAMDVLARVIGWKLSLHAVPTQGLVTVTSAGGPSNRYPLGTPVTFERISGHRDGDNTACPGDVLYTQLPQLRTAAAQFAGPAAGLILYAAREVRGVKASAVSGYLRFPDGSPAAGAAITVEYLRTDLGAAQAWATVASAVAAADGTWRATVELPATGRLRAAFAGDATRARLESAPRTVTVLARLNLTLDRTLVRRGGRVNLSGVADPATHVRLTLQHRSRRRWLTSRRRLIRVREGTYRAFVRPRSAGRYRVSVQVGRVVRRRAIRVF